MRAAGVVFAAVLVPFLGACATKQDVRDLRLDLEAQRAQQDSLIRVVLRRTDAVLDSLSQQNFRLRGDVANRLTQIERQLVTIQELTGQGQQQLRDLQREIDRRAAEAQAAQSAGGGVPAPANTVSEAEAEQLYQAALAALRRGSVSTARGGFEQFLRAAPQHRLAPDAQFNLGQAFEQDEKWDDAVVAYSRVVELYPTSARAPAALLRIGKVELGRGKRAEARARFNQLVRAYPRSQEAAEAERELTRLGRG